MAWLCICYEMSLQLHICGTRTNWNRYCSSTLRRLLPKLEENKAGRSLRDRHQHTAPVTGSVEPINMNIHPNLNEEHLIELREVMASYQVSPRVTFML